MIYPANTLHGVDCFPPGRAACMIEMPPARIGRRSADHDSSCWALNPDKESVCVTIHHARPRSRCWWARSPAPTVHRAPHPTPLRCAGRLSTAARPELLARSLALALGDPAFRAHVKAELDRSPFREHKLSFQRFLGADRGRALSAIAGRTGVATTELARAADQAIPLEMYLPVPEHRRSWTGDASVLVATAVADHDPPVAFDVQGNRQLLDPERPPATPVIALVPVETDFSTAPAPIIGCWTCGFWPPLPPPRRRSRACT